MTALLLLLTVSFCAFGQTDTTDSKICIPKRWMRKATVELLRYDDCRKEILLLKPRIAAQERVIEALSGDTAAKAERIDFLNARIQSERITSATLEMHCNAALQQYQQQAKRTKAKGLFHTVLVGFSAFAAGYFIHTVTR